MDFTGANYSENQTAHGTAHREFRAEMNQLS